MTPPDTSVYLVRVEAPHRVFARGSPVRGGCGPQRGNEGRGPRQGGGGGEIQAAPGVLGTPSRKGEVKNPLPRQRVSHQGQLARRRLWQDGALLDVRDNHGLGGGRTLHRPGPDAAEENERIFDALYAKKDEIERAFGGPLVWDCMEGRRACRVWARLDLGGLSHRDRWP